MLAMIKRAFSPMPTLAHPVMIEGRATASVLALGEGFPTNTSVETMTEEEFEIYANVIKKNGMLDSPSYHTAWLERELVQHNAQIYPYASVERYLDYKFPKGWVWRPVRHEDTHRMYSDNRNYRQRGDYRIAFGGISADVYHKRIPLPVLETIAEYPAGCLFFISDERTPSDYLDPFLAIGRSLTDLYIIERWNEPSFRR